MKKITNKASAVLSECVIYLERGDSEITRTIREGQRYKPKAKQLSRTGKDKKGTGFAGESSGR